MNTAVSRRNELEEELQQVILDGIQVAVRGGKVLSAIREERLWADDYGSFDEYCERLWCLPRAAAMQWVRAWEVAKTVSETEDTMAIHFVESIEGMSLSASQALFQVEPENRRMVWSEAREASPSPSAKVIEAVATKHRKLFAEPTTKEEELAFLQSVEGEIREGVRLVKTAEAEQIASKKLRAICRVVEGFSETSTKLKRVKNKLDEAMSILQE